MKNKAKFIVFFMIWNIAINGKFDSYASSCGILDIQKSIKDSDLIFIGTVEKTKHVGDAHELYKEERYAHCGAHAVTLVVKETFKGKTPQKIEILTPDSCLLLGVQFEKGKNYLVYAYGQASQVQFMKGISKIITDYKYTTNICVRTQPINRANEDIEFLRNQATKNPQKEPL